MQGRDECPGRPGEGNCRLVGDLAADDAQGADLMSPIRRPRGRATSASRPPAGDLAHQLSTALSEAWNTAATSPRVRPAAPTRPPPAVDGPPVSTATTAVCRTSVHSQCRAGHVDDGQVHKHAKPLVETVLLVEKPVYQGLHPFVRPKVQPVRGSEGLSGPMPANDVRCVMTRRAPTMPGSSDFLLAYRSNLLITGLSLMPRK